ncbi:hypothetical protein [Candidatus Methylopumilus universalis]|jgi:hypothetical protein|uniref:hypothetical protein n=1 Tax=Candidatus Methylopumilus TaxID=1679002 RepID=UPI001CB93E91|nr:hypothetical protein [Candidatus Methylopumilus universalis]
MTLIKNLGFQSVCISIFLFSLMTLTRGSHLLSSISLPDASLVLFLIGGIYLKNIRFFIALFLLGLFIDFGAAALDPKLGFCLTKGYWGLIPAYASLWVCGYFLNKQKYLQKLSIFIPYVSIAVVVAFLISTQTYYLFSGRFGSPSLAESLLHGWEYLPQYFLSSFIYIALFWLTQNIIIKNKIFSNLKKFKSL